MGKVNYLPQEVEGAALKVDRGLWHRALEPTVSPKPETCTEPLPVPYLF